MEILSIVALSVAALAPRAMGQEATPAEHGDRLRITPSARLDADWIFDADLEDDEGQLAISRLAGVLGVEIPLSERAKLRIGASYELSSYEFDADPNTSPLPFLASAGDDPFDHLQSFGFNAGFQSAIDQRTSWFIRGSVEHSGEPGADFADGLTYSLMGGVIYGASESMQIGIGAGFSTRLAKSTLYLPLPIIDWRIHEKWRLEVGPGPGATLTYQATEQLAVWLAGEWETRAWRLDEEDLAPEGVLRDESISALLGIRWTPTRQISLEGGVGIVLDRELTVFDSDDHELESSEIDPAPMLHLSMGYRF